MSNDLIDVPLWDAAKWQGIVFSYAEEQVPFVALIFLNGDAALRIFADWIRKLGKEDVDDVLRLAFIEGNIPGREPGYSVTIGPHNKNVIATAKGRGEETAWSVSRSGPSSEQGNTT